MEKRFADLFVATKVFIMMSLDRVGKPGGNLAVYSHRQGRGHFLVTIGRTKTPLSRPAASLVVKTNAASSDARHLSCKRDGRPMC